MGVWISRNERMMGGGGVKEKSGMDAVWRFSSTAWRRDGNRVSRPGLAD